MPHELSPWILPTNPFLPKMTQIRVTDSICSPGYSLSCISGVRYQISWKCHGLKTLMTKQNGSHFADDTFKRIFLNENVRISLKFVSKGPINNIPVFVQIRAWRRPGDRPLSEPMMTRLPTHVCVTRPPWVKRKISSFMEVLNAK